MLIIREENKMAIIILSIIFIIIAVVIYNTVGFWEFFKSCSKDSFVVSMASLVVIIPIGICYLIVGLIHVLLGGLKHGA